MDSEKPGPPRCNLSNFFIKPDFDYGSNQSDSEVESKSSKFDQYYINDSIDGWTTMMVLMTLV